ncbi:hypothetical protein BJ170DRAFT_4846 [Xylariales sp. AK1849]|nr:hypothetical protein BJ170DRAFT_4846 [Xylariales sp. AK1849]
MAPSVPVLDSPDPGPGSSASTGPVDSPATPLSQNALARFEFETGKGNEGTKILLAEWDPTVEGGDSASTQQAQEQGGWEVSWEGKRTMVSLSEREDNATQRVYFLIPSDVTVPPMIKISQPSTGRTLSTKAMPAIFAPALGLDTKKDAGKRGVLHTIWAKKRLSQIQEEIRREMQSNAEGVALEMVVQERQWIIEHFGLEDPNIADRPAKSIIPPAPQSPRSPIGGRLGEKLRGLKLATSPSELADAGGQRHHHLYSLSPETSDIAVPSRAALSTATAQKQLGGVPGNAVASLDAIVEGDKPGTGMPETRANEDELFALPMSPRSPEMKKSPFSLL